jgi:hypothetical protein
LGHPNRRRQLFAVHLGAPMKLNRITVLTVLCLMLVACGGGKSDTINGNWNFTTPTPCFDAFHGQSATFTSSGIVNGNITGAFTLGIGTLIPAQPQNELNLQGNVNGKTIAGNWTLTGGATPGCNNDSGAFTMTRN